MTKAQIVQWQEGSEGHALYGAASVLRPEDREDFEGLAPYGYTLGMGEVDMDRMVLVQLAPGGVGEPRETPVTLWSLHDQRDKLGAEANSKEAERAAADLVAAARPGASGAKALAAEVRKVEIRAVLAEVEAEKAR